MERLFDAWLIAHFAETNFVNLAKEGSLWGALADPDGDGIANLSEYSYGLNPTVADSGSPLAVAVVNRHLRVTFTRRRDDPALSVTPGVSGDLVTWSEGPGFVREIGVVPLGPVWSV